MGKSLSQSFVDTVTIASGRRLLADHACKGLYLDLRPKGKSWRFRFTGVGGKLTSVTIGDATKISLEAARRKAHLLGFQKLSRSSVLSHEGSAVTYGGFVQSRYLPFAFSTKKAALWEEIIQRVHLLPVFADYPLHEINKGVIIEFIQSKQRAKYKAGSINRMISILKVTLSKAVEWEVGGLEISPAKGVKLLKDPPKLDRYLTPDEAKRLLDELRSNRASMLRFIIPFLLFTGARKREALDAQWKDIDWSNRLWLIPITKSGKPRVVPLSDQAMQVLKATKDELKQLGFTDTQWVFPNPDTGKPYVSVFHSWDRCRKAVGLDDVRIHDLRHSFASALVNRGMTLYDVKEALGHANIITTQRYAHLSPQRLRDAVRQAGEHYGEGMK